MQFVHSVNPLESAAFPAGQSVQAADPVSFCVRPAAEYLPLAHSALVVAASLASVVPIAANLPAAASVQPLAVVVCVLEANVPIGQLVQEEAPAAECLPAGQSETPCAAELEATLLPIVSEEYLPAAAIRQLFVDDGAPAAVLYLPDGHGSSWTPAASTAALFAFAAK